jgi:hypothetical protein
MILWLWFTKVMGVLNISLLFPLFFRDFLPISVVRKYYVREREMEDCRRTKTDMPLCVGKIEVDDAVNLCS